MLKSIRSAASKANKILQSGDILGATLFAGRTLLRSQRPVSTRLHSIDITLRPCTTDFVAADTSFAGEFDEIISAATPLRHNFIIDAGGYIGTAAIVFARAFPAATIVSIEPSEENFRILKKNVAPYPNIVPVNKALGSRVGDVSLVNRGTGHWGFSIIQAPADASRPQALHQVEVTTIPVIMSEYGAKAIDILKLDIEGAELHLLTPRPTWIDSVDLIFAELHDRIVPGCEAAFAAATEGRKNSKASGQEKTLSAFHGK